MDDDFIEKRVLKRARSEYPRGRLIVNPDYYAENGIPCPRTKKLEICHEGRGNIGYICKYYGGCYHGDRAVTNCLFGEPIQLELF